MMGGMTTHDELRSMAMYSSFCWHHPSRVLFDAGDGVAMHLHSRMFGVEYLLVGHGDSDHVNGIFSLIGLRAKTKGDTRKNLTIVHPSDDPRFDLIKGYIKAMWPRLPYKLTWLAADPGFELQLSGGHRLKAFSMKHRSTTTLGWRMIESRSRLKPEHRGKDIRALIAGGMTKDQLNEVYQQTTFVYALDSYDLNPADIAGADVCICDCTFLKDGDRTDMTHATLNESIAVCREAGVKTMVAAHISSRYGLEHQREVAARLSAPDNGLDMEVKFCFTDRVLDL